mmetsp:Transcript_10103/g.30864  ORF Transcript_10103/g.30864 Transcript_10103/m.30864 type:complete len:122 (+) Transcript_10103:152-517(+)
MGMPFKSYLSGNRVYACTTCGCHLANNEDIISKQFHGRHGKAFLFSSVVNVGVGDKEERMLITGLHTVADIFCNVCLSVLGWKYVSVEPSCSEASCQPSFTHVLKASSFLLPATANLPRTA